MRHKVTVHFASGRVAHLEGDPKDYNHVKGRWILPQIISRSLSTRLRGLSDLPTGSRTMIPISPPEVMQLKLL